MSKKRVTIYVEEGVWRDIRRGAIEVGLSASDYLVGFYLGKVSGEGVMTATEVKARYDSFPDEDVLRSGLELVKNDIAAKAIKGGWAEPIRDDSEVIADAQAKLERIKEKKVSPPNLPKPYFNPMPKKGGK